MSGFVVLHGHIFLARGDGPCLHHRALLAIHHSNLVVARHIDEKPGTGLFDRHRLQTIRIELQIRQLLSRCGIYDANQAVRRVGFAAAVNDVKVLRVLIKDDRVRIDGQFDVPDQLVRLVFEDLDLRRLAVDNKDLIQFREGQNIMGFLKPSDGMNVLVGAQVENLHPTHSVADPEFVAIVNHDYAVGTGGVWVAGVADEVTSEPCLERVR